jgi:hypothetical protein
MGIPALTDTERRDLTDPRAEFTAEERVVVAMTYLLSGENAALAASRASKALEHEVPAGTLRQWRRRPWWAAAEAAGKRRLQVELENGYTRLLHLTEENMLERIENGDSRLTKDGDVVRVPVSLRDLVGAHAIVAQQRAMVRGEPTSNKEMVGLALAVKLAEVFHQRGQESMKDSDMKVIDVAFVEMDAPGSEEPGPST